MSKVSRSVYQKLSEENKKLISDIRILTTQDVHLDKIHVTKKWREKFAKDKLFHALLKECVTKYFKDNPDKRLQP